MVASNLRGVNEKMKKSTVHSRAVANRNSLIEHLAAKGFSIGAIATEMGLRPGTVRTVLKQPESIARVESIHEQIASMIRTNAANLGEKFDSLAPEAADRLIRLVRCETDDVANPVPHAVSFQAAREVLDRAPSAPGKKMDNVDARQLHIHLPEKQFANAQQALRDVGMLVDVEKGDE